MLRLSSNFWGLKRTEAEEFEKKLFGSRNAAHNVVTNPGGHREQRNGIQVNVNINIKTNQEVEREGERNVYKVNPNIDTEINQREEGTLSRALQTQPCLYHGCI